MTASGDVGRDLRRARMDELEKELVEELEGVHGLVKRTSKRARFYDMLREPLAFTVALLVGVIVWRVWSFEAATLTLLACVYGKATIARPLR